MRLRIWLPPLAELRSESRVEFDVLDAKRRIQHHGESSVAMLPKAMGCELVLHASDCVLLDVRLPRLTRSKLASALPSLVEERIATDVDRVHVVATERDPDGVAVAAVVDRAMLSRALDVFKRAGRPVVSALAHPLALPWEPGKWHVRLRDQAGSVRTGNASGVALSASGGSPVELQLLIAQAIVKPVAIEVDGDCDVNQWSEVLGVEVRQISPDQRAPAVTLDLMQYEFSPGVADWKKQRTLVLLGALLLLVSVGGLNLHAWKLHVEEKRLRARMSQIVSEAIPGVAAVLDPLLQVQRKVAALRAGAGIGGSGFLSDSLALSEAIDTNTLDSLEYRDGALLVGFSQDVADTDLKRKELIARCAEAGLVLRFSDGVARMTRKTGG